MRAPEQVGLGTAKMKISFDAWKEGKVAAAVAELTVVQKKVLVSRPVSPNLRATLAGPDSEAVVWAVAWSADGSQLAAGFAGPDGRILVWDAASGKVRHKLASSGGIYSLGFLDAKTLATTHWEQKVKRVQIDGKPGNVVDPTGDIRLWDLDTGKLRATLQHSPRRGVSRSAFSRDGKTIAASEVVLEAGGKDKMFLTLWDVTTGKVRASVPDLFGPTAIAPDGKTLAVSSDTVTLVDVISGKKVGTLTTEKGSGGVNSLDWSPDGKSLAGATFRGEIFVWDVEKRLLRATLKCGERMRITAVAFSRDSQTLAAVMQETPSRPPRSMLELEPPRIELWDLASGKKRDTLTAPRGATAGLAWSPDGKTLAAGTLGSVQLWDVAGFGGK